MPDRTFASLKLAIPPAHPLDLKRPRLLRQVNEGLRRKLTIVSAPPGYGKTTLISQWASAAALKVAWLTLDKDDNDPALFFKNLLNCLQTVNKNIGKDAFKMLQSGRKPAMEEVLKKMAEQAGMVLQDFVMVLDNYQVIESHPVHNMVSTLLNYLPPQMHLFIINESDPPWSLAALRSAGQISELRAPYLAFTMDEAGALFNEVMQLKLAYGEISALIARAEAQPAALKYAALCLKHFPGGSGEFIAGFEAEERGALQFLAEALFRQQSEAVKEWIRKSSIADLLNETLCGALTGSSESAEILKKLSGQGAFFFAVDAAGEWYRFHPFLRKLLADLFREGPAENWDDLHRRAFRWFGQHGWIRPAFRHALAARDYDAAGQLLEQHAFAMLENGELVTVENWLAVLPETLLKSRPMLSVCRAWVLIISDQLEMVDSCLNDALAGKENFPEPEEIAGHVSAIREFLAEKKRDRD